MEAGGGVTSRSRQLVLACPGCCCRAELQMKREAGTCLSFPRLHLGDSATFPVGCGLGRVTKAFLGR